MSVSFCSATTHELGELPGVVLGIGLLAAATAAGRFLLTRRPEAMVFVGSAGAYPSGPKVGIVVASGALGLASTAVALGLGYQPRAPAVLSADAALLARTALTGSRVLTVAAITTDVALAERFGAEWEVEHLEAYAVAFACAAAGVPFAAILGIANRVGPDAHAEWLRNHDAVEASARTVAARLLVR
ncbi:MAG: hypothetical protein EXR71_09845 [Myxococcales bacterium]|nr:hypothetical protein [Myxococcales bacterium]